MDLLVFASGLGDIFPRDILSSSGSKYIEIRPKDEVDSIQVSQDTHGSDDKCLVRCDELSVATLSNRIRDQEVCINRMNKELIKTRTDLIKKLDIIEQLLRIVLPKSNTGDISTHDNLSARAGGNETPVTNNSEESNSDNMLPQVQMSRVGGVPPPPGFLNNNTGAKEPVVTPVDVSRQLRKFRNSSDNIRSRTYTDSGCVTLGAASSALADGSQQANDHITALPQASEASSSDSNITETSSSETHRDMEYSEAASIPGPWLQQRTSARRRRPYRDSPDHYDTDKTSGSAHDGRSRTKSPKIQLRGANKEPFDMGVCP